MSAIMTDLQTVTRFTRSVKHDLDCTCKLKLPKQGTKGILENLKYKIPTIANIKKRLCVNIGRPVSLPQHQNKVSFL